MQITSRTEAISAIAAQLASFTEAVGPRPSESTFPVNITLDEYLSDIGLDGLPDDEPEVSRAREWWEACQAQIILDVAKAKKKLWVKLGEVAELAAEWKIPFDADLALSTCAAFTQQYPAWNSSACW